MANQLAQSVQQLKTMIEQAKAQSAASRDAAILNSKIMFDAEKKEVRLQTFLLTVTEGPCFNKIL